MTQSQGGDLELENQSNVELIICVQDAHKHYGTRTPLPVLDGLNMTVPKGVIYGLLGASGCGKTTLLKCILGQKKLNSGRIWVLDQTLDNKSRRVLGHRVGYMPQDVGLYKDFTIHETFQYFGWITEMNDEDIKEGFEMLSTMLMLPESDRRVNTLSGGQQRRLSLAAALLHKPELLILDEPTVGVDPVLREVIWDHLLSISKKERTTVIITTHYIDEVKQAHIVGLMRGGKLLAEEQPQSLLRTLGTDTLEDAFLKLCVGQNSNQQKSDDATPPTNTSEPSKVVKLAPVSHREAPRTASKVSPNSHLPNIKHLKAIIWKNIIWWRRNMPTLAFVTLLPLVQAILFCLTIGRDLQDLPIAVANHEKNSTLGCSEKVTCNSTHLGCNYLNHLERLSFRMVYYNSEHDAEEAVFYGKAYASVTFRQNYSAAMRTRLQDGKDTRLWDIDSSTIKIFNDVSNGQISTYIEIHMYEAYENFVREFLLACDISPTVIKFPIRWNDPVYGLKYPTYTDFVAPGALVTLVFVMGVMLTGSAMFVERKEASLERSLIMGITETELMISHIICSSVLVVIQALLIMAGSFGIFDLTHNGSFVIVTFLHILAGFTGMCYGLLAACVCESPRTIDFMTTGIFMPLIVVSGVIWPLEGVHYLLKPIAPVVPTAQTIEGVRSVLQRSWDLSYSKVFMGVVSSSVWIVIFILVAMYVLKFKNS